MKLFELKAVLNVLEIPCNELNEKDVLQEVSLWNGLKISYFNNFSVIIEGDFPIHFNSEKHLVNIVEEKGKNWLTYRINSAYQLVEFIVNFKKIKLNCNDDINMIMAKINGLLLLNSNARLSISEWMQQNGVIENEYAETNQYMTNLLPLFDEAVRKPITYLDSNPGLLYFNADKDSSLLYFILPNQRKNPDILYLKGLNINYNVNDNHYSLKCSLHKIAQNGIYMILDIEHIYTINSDNSLNELLQVELTYNYFKYTNDLCQEKEESYYVVYDVASDKITHSSLINYSDDESKRLVIRSIGEMISALNSQEIRIGKSSKKLTKSN